MMAADTQRPLLPAQLENAVMLTTLPPIDLRVGREAQQPNIANMHSSCCLQTCSNKFWWWWAAAGGRHSQLANGLRDAIRGRRVLNCDTVAAAISLGTKLLCRCLEDLSRGGGWQRGTGLAGSRLRWRRRARPVQAGPSAAGNLSEQLLCKTNGRGK